MAKNFRRLLFLPHPVYILMQFTLEMYAAATNCKNNTKTPILEAQAHSRSLMFTPIKSLALLLVMISSMSAPICNHFHATRDN